MTRRSSVDHSKMHQMNLALILNTMRLHAPISRAGLAAKTGLNKATVSSMAKTLLEHRHIREIGLASKDEIEVGRPAINLELNPDAGYLVGVEIGVGFITVVITNFALEVVDRHSSQISASVDADELLSQLVEILQKAIDPLRKRKRAILGIGVGVPGLVDMASGTLLFAPNLHWRDVPLKAQLASALDLPIFLANEANLAALGESYLGAGQHCDSILYVSSGIGLGGGIVLNDVLLEGASGFAGEIGHMMVDPQGLRCNCGKTGCWETVATQQAVFRYIRKVAAEGRVSLLADWVNNDWDQLTIPIVIKGARDGDLVATEALEQAARWLGIGIGNLVNVLNPQQVIFGGPLSVAHEILLPIIRQEVVRNTLPWIAANTEIIAAAHLADAAVMGAVAVVHQEIVNHPLDWIP